MRRVRNVGRALAVVLVAACGSEPAQAPELAKYLYEQSGQPAVVDAWLMTRAQWNRVVVDPYQRVYDDYVKAFAAQAPKLRAQLAAKHPIVTRAHVAGDPVSTHDQAMTRWALPTLAPTRVAQLAGNPATNLDAVFVDVGGQWKAIVGLGTIIRAYVAEHDMVCAVAIARLDPAGGRCIEIAYEVADAALRDDRARLSHVCGLATTVCGKPAP